MTDSEYRSAMADAAWLAGCAVRQEVPDRQRLSGVKRKNLLAAAEKHKLVSAVGMEQILDRDNPKVRENPACYFDRAEMLVAAIQEEPWLLRTPVVRNGNRITVGYRPEVWSQWE